MVNTTLPGCSSWYSKLAAVLKGLGYIEKFSAKFISTTATESQASSTSFRLLHPVAFSWIVMSPFGLFRKSQILCTSHVDKEGLL